MTDYSKINDHVINCKVAQITGESAPKVEEWGISRIVPDYCNDPAYAWPIVISSMISIDSIFDKGNAWLAFGGDDSEHRHVNSNPLRAAMIVFLMMKESENEVR